MSGVLTTHGLTKRFPGVVALDGVDFSARAGEVHALMGENGAARGIEPKFSDAQHEQ